MTRRRLGAALGAVIALGIAIACGDVPTLPLGISYITPILPPMPTVAWGDTLRDSLGHAVPLRVYAIARNGIDTVQAATLRFIITSVGSGATIDPSGYLVVPDSLQTIRVVAQLTDPAGSELQLQTPELSIDVVPRADTIVRTTPPDSVVLPVTPLSVTVSGAGPAARGTVSGIRVSFRITRVFPATVPTTGRYYLLDDESSRVLRPDSTIAIDTTNSAGVAQRSFVSVLAPDGGANADSVVVEATARSQAGVPLKGSPVRFVVRIKKS